jgi:hypothetical protein
MKANACEFPGSWSFASLEFLCLSKSVVLQLGGIGPLYRQIYRAFQNKIDQVCKIFGTFSLQFT